jgi:hypothetical protein
MNQILCKVSDEDAKKLVDTIDEANACKVLFDSAKTKMDCTSQAFKIILEYFKETQKAHWTLWRDLLVKYIGEDDTSKLYNLLKFDAIKKEILKLEVEGCVLCNNSKLN